MIRIGDRVIRSGCPLSPYHFITHHFSQVPTAPAFSLFPGRSTVLQQHGDGHGLTPLGTGVIAEAIGATASKSTSPTVRRTFYPRHPFQ